MADRKIRLWLKTDDEKKIKEIIPEIEWKKYSDGILTGELEEPGHIAKIGKTFVIGRKKIWLSEDIPREEDGGNPFAYIKNSSAYTEGLILTPYSDIDVEYHLKSELIKRQHREELLGDDSVDFVERIFRTYGNSLINKFGEKDNHLVLYEVIK